MRTNRSLRFAGIVIALTVTLTTAFSTSAQQGKNRNKSKAGTCINQISGLSQGQKDQITALETTHQTTMSSLREKRQSATTSSEKDQLRNQMNTEVSNHRNAVRSLLNTGQQSQFDQIPRNQNGQQGNAGQSKQRRGTGNCTGQGFGKRGR